MQGFEFELLDEGKAHDSLERTGASTE